MLGVTGLNMMAARLSPGAFSESSSSHLPPSEASKTAKPVMFPPGRSSRGTRPMATGSPALAKTLGIVRVSRWTATVAGVVNGGQDRYRMRGRVSRLPGLTVGVVMDRI